jgi:3-oxoacyl-[acyl-carrier-protein] synthase-3
MNTIINNVKVSAISVAIPKNYLDLDSLKSVYGENEVKRIIDSTGIKKVRVAEAGMKTSDLCYAAARNLMSQIHLEPMDVDAIVLVTQTSDGVMPATSVTLQHKLGLPTHVVALDINYGCSGYVYGLYISSLLIASGGCKKVLMCAGDVITPLIKPNDRNVRMVFGDAGSATLVEKGDDNIAFSIKTDGSGKDFLKTINDDGIDPYIAMDGAAVMTFALRDVPFIIDQLLGIKEWKHDEVGVYALHQANKFMLNYLRKKMKINKINLPISVEDTGNTGPASIPLLLTQLHQQIQQDGKLTKSILCGFGVGLSCAAAALNLADTIMLDPIEI